MKKNTLLFALFALSNLSFSQAVDNLTPDCVVKADKEVNTCFNNITYSNQFGFGPYGAAGFTSEVCAGGGLEDHWLYTLHKFEHPAYQNSAIQKIEIDVDFSYVSFSSSLGISQGKVLLLNHSCSTSPSCSSTSTNYQSIENCENGAYVLGSFTIDASTSPFTFSYTIDNSSTVNLQALEQSSNEFSLIFSQNGTGVSKILSSKAKITYNVPLGIEDDVAIGGHIDPNMGGIQSPVTTLVEDGSSCATCSGYSYNMDFIDNYPYGDYITSGETKFTMYHSEGEYVYATGGPYGLNFDLDNIPNYDWIRPSDDKIKGKITFLGEDSDGVYHYDELPVLVYYNKPNKVNYSIASTSCNSTTIQFESVGATDYKIKYYDVNKCKYEFINVPAGQYEYTFDEATYGKNFLAQVIASNANGVKESESKTMNFCATSAVITISSISPNPVKSIMNIRFDVNDPCFNIAIKDAEIEIVDMFGVVVKHDRIKLAEDQRVIDNVDVSMLKTGAHTLRLSVNSRTYSASMNFVKVD